MPFVDELGGNAVAENLFNLFSELPTGLALAGLVEAARRTARTAPPDEQLLWFRVAQKVEGLVHDGDDE